MTWRLQPDGSYLSDSSSFKAFQEAGIWKLVNLNVDEGRFLSYQELLNFPPVPAGTLPNPYNNNIILGPGFFINSEIFISGFTTIQNGNIDLGTGNVVYSAGTPVAGFYDDETPFFRRVVRGSILNASTFVIVNHGIANLYSGDRLRAITTATRHIPNSTGYGIHGGPSPLTEAFYPLTSVEYNNTQITAIRSNPVGQTDVIFVVEYV
ncbi:hypothetical protein LEP1GSC079_1808 [Leptospira interrogans str. FPW1039]|uniref:Uncharacterized protein n=1 Tax=Leptospira interrogans str. FPW1039 TaxID=1193040 RepID=A0A0F6IIU8_LEPIR|nr:hypothetical protein [Leptospira interrogans]EMJ37973.1 hypothetical protein LEP1GSC079_1808 [Leptospira interrogans str. FPW1039]